MVARKPVPVDATFDPAVPSQAPTPPNNNSNADPWAATNAEEESIWGQHDAGNSQDARLTPNDIPSSLKPGAASGYGGFEEDENVWAQGNATTAGGGIGQVPSVLLPGSSHSNTRIGLGERRPTEQHPILIPAVLQPAGGAYKQETNPFKRKMAQHQDEAAHNQPPVFDAPSIPPIPIASFQQLSVNDANNNPWEPTVRGPVPPPVPGYVEENEAESDNIWDSAKPSRLPTPGPGTKSPEILSLPSEEGLAGWEDEKRTDAPKLVTTEEDEVLGDSHAWDDLGSLKKDRSTAKPPSIPGKGSGSGDEWNLIDMDPRPGPPSRKSTWENFGEEDNAPKPGPSTAEESPQAQPPTLPPRTSAEAPPPQPARPVDKNETYQIKNINWYDVTAPKNPRTSPILVQNANGPCPLVALVNALSLTTPADKVNTALVEALKSREQVSLGLLLDAVFDELMSERRTKPDVPLPDVTELYNFLQGLHTGMNVNPRFVPTPEVIKAFKRTSLTHLHPTERSDTTIPGTFEHTKEMSLYSTFSIPLIHGWLPSQDEPVYNAFVRQATSYEDAQNMLFREEELDQKLTGQGLTGEEESMYHDIITIKSFLDSSATQLTNFGLDVIRKSMKPGSVAILFRNDHFSTLYRHPETLELFTLVTDAGYAGHAEVVWESLVDINGLRAEFYSGDFRLVGGASQSHSPAADRRGGSRSEGNGQAQGRRGRNQTMQSSSSNDPPISPTHEQEDRDLALALQLQEEEEERHRREQERRRRESQLSEQYIEQQANSGPNNGGGGVRPGQRVSSARGPNQSTASLLSVGSSGTNATGRRIASSPGSTHVRVTSSPQASSNRPRPQAQTVRSLIPPAGRPAVSRPAEEGLDDAPPSYEQASRQAAYEPPEGHPSHPQSSPMGTGPGPEVLTPVVGSSSSPRQSGSVRNNNNSSTTTTTGYRPTSGSAGTPRPMNGAPGQGVPVSNSGTKERDCIVM
ncbi:protein FAM63A [Podospora fimiseda]|uniref:Protein FAM63A n=1 Tax=Podospora fimiseda TaxID=252190 RepID=A0AAN7BSQ5_9PEZI|nr:protein FAM63A [Podospora fimiseda]